MSAPVQFRPLELRLAPEYRRCAVYVAAGYFLVAGTLIGLRVAEADNLTWAKMAVGLPVLGLPTVLLLVLTFRYRIRIDQHGVWRRRFVHWDLWPWEAFEGGKVRHGRLGDQLTYPDKPWHRRTISASLLGERDRTAFETVVRRYHVPPPPPDVPEALTIKYGVRNRLELSADGVRLIGPRDDGEVVLWPDVVRAEVIRTAHERPGFGILELHLPGRPKPIRFSHHQGTPTWTGADAEVIALFLARHLGDERFQVTANRGPPTDVAEADRRLARLDAAERDLRKTRRVMCHLLGWSGLALAVIMFDPWNRPNPWNWGLADWLDAAMALAATAALLSLHGALFLGAAHIQARELRRQRAGVLGWRAEHAETAPI